MAVTITEDSVKAMKLKKELEKDSEEGTQTRVVGFMIPNETEEEEYEEDD